MARNGVKTGGGSRKGRPNKATADIKALAQDYTADAIKALAKLAGLVDNGSGAAESEQARVAALKEILDRGHGKASQEVHGSVTISLESLVLAAAAKRETSGKG